MPASGIKSRPFSLETSVPNGRCSTSYRLTLAPDQAVVLVAVPPNGKLERRGTQLLVDGIVVDYRVAKP